MDGHEVKWQNVPRAADFPKEEPEKLTVPNDLQGRQKGSDPMPNPGTGGAGGAPQ